MKKISLDDFNDYLEKANIKFYFSIIFDDLSYVSIADNYFVYDRRDGNVVVTEDAFASSEFIKYIYEPFILSLKDKKIVEGETANEMFNYTYCNTIRAQKDGIYVMIHGGSKELFEKPFDDEIIDRINKKAYAFFDSVDNSVDRQIFNDLKPKVLQFVSDYGLDH